jgi:SNF2 family DNA or RNA helicase
MQKRQPEIVRVPLWNHQLEAYAFAYPREATLLAMGLGTGKSATATALLDNWEANRVLILAPCSVRAVWRREIAKHAARDYRTIILDSGSIRKRTAIAEKAWNDSPTPLIIVANYEAMLYEPLRSWVLGRRWDAVVCDEGHRIMGESKTALLAVELRKVANRRLILSATSLTQDPLTVFAQARFLDPSIFGDDLDAFKERYENKWSLGYRKALKKLAELGLRLADEKAHYAVDAENEEMRSQFAAVIARLRNLCTRPWERPDYLICGTINTEEYLERLGSIAFRCENAVLDLPPLTVERRVFDLSRLARRVYDAIANGYEWETLTGIWPDLHNSFQVTMRCQQVTSGFLPLKTGKVVHLDSGKADLCKELLEEAGGEPVVVFCRFREDLDTIKRLADELGLRYGEVSGRSKNGIDDKAQLAPWVQVCGLQETAGGAGIDLSASRIGIDYSPGWSLATSEQKVARLHRPRPSGSPPENRPVVIYRLEAVNTIDGEIRRAIDARGKIVNGVWTKMRTGVIPEMAEV